MTVGNASWLKTAIRGSWVLDQFPLRYDPSDGRLVGSRTEADRDQRGIAAQACAVSGELGFDPATTNRNGGAIASVIRSGRRASASLTTLLRRRTCVEGPCHPLYRWGWEWQCASKAPFLIALRRR